MYVASAASPLVRQDEGDPWEFDAPTWADLSEAGGAPSSEVRVATLYATNMYVCGFISFGLGCTRMSWHPRYPA